HWPINRTSTERQVPCLGILETLLGAREGVRQLQALLGDSVRERNVAPGAEQLIQNADHAQSWRGAKKGSGSLHETRTGRGSSSSSTARSLVTSPSPLIPWLTAMKSSASSAAARDASDPFQAGRQAGPQGVILHRDPSP